MRLIFGLLVAAAPFASALADPAPAAPPAQCEVPDTLVEDQIDLDRAIAEIKDKHRLDIVVIGSGSSALSGPEGARAAYPARLENALKQRLPGTDVKVTAHTQPKETTAAMTAALGTILASDKPSLVIWQAGTVDAVNGVDPEDFRTSLDRGVEAIQAAGADVILMNMQYSPRTEAMLDVSSFADIMRIVAEQRGALLFDRLAIMRYWNDEGVFDLYTTTKNYDMARHVHDCIGWALASQIINAAHLTP